MNFRKPKALSRLRLVTLIAAIGTLALVSSAAAVVYVYSNGFNSRESYREINKIGGRNSCDRSFLKEKKAMGIDFKGRDFCEYSPPVAGDNDQPDHEIVAEGRILKDTPKSVREQSYLGVRVRVGAGTYYEFRVTPKGRDFKLNREPSGPGLPISGSSSRINKLGASNRLRLRVTNGKVTAFVNGKSVATYADPNVNQVTGRKVSFGLGNTKKARSGPIGIIKSVKVGVPTP